MPLPDGTDGSLRKDWRETRVLVTGAGGFIGSHLLRRLRLLDAEVHATSRRARTRATQGVTWHVSDLGDPDAVGELLRRTRPDVVFHLASEVTGSRDVRIVPATLRANLTSVVNLLTAVTETPETRVVLAGSLEEPREGEPTPSSPYAVAKWAASGYARMFHRLYGVPVSTLRIAMVYGPGQPDTSKLVPYVTLALLRGEEPAIGSGTRLLDWIHVDDVVDAFVCAAERERAAGGSFEIGSGVGTSIRETVEMLHRIVGGASLPRFGALSDRPLDSARIADLQLADEILGWRPATKLEQGLSQTVAWYSGRL
ncbi:NAD-dependent epimerase/dehydratase family protein [Streptosporangium soli]|nr:NAD-dependent epimerase/dehydratase family protein [Streptosporangium sp. KLBMP 9127]